MSKLILTNDIMSVLPAFTVLHIYKVHCKIYMLYRIIKNLKFKKEVGINYIYKK